MNATASSIAGVCLAIAITVLGTSCSTSVASEDTAGDSVPTVPIHGDPLAGAHTYRAVCATCHGADLGGVEGLALHLVPSSFIINTPASDLIEFIIIGQPSDHPDNTTGVAMLPRGGNPSLSDQSIADIVAYIKAQQ